MCGWKDSVKFKKVITIIFNKTRGTPQKSIISIITWFQFIPYCKCFAVTCNYALIITKQSQNLSALFILHFYGYSVYVFYSQVSETSTFILICMFLFTVVKWFKRITFWFWKQVFCVSFYSTENPWEFCDNATCMCS